MNDLGKTIEEYINDKVEHRTDLAVDEWMHNNLDSLVADAVKADNEQVCDQAIEAVIEYLDSNLADILNDRITVTID